MSEEKIGSQTQRKLTNQDFRNIMLTARSARAVDPKKVEINNQPKKYKLKQPYLHKLKERPEKKKPEESNATSQYRDRAKERRDGELNEVLGLKELTQLSNQFMNPITKVAIGAQECVDPTKSKYLGGDVDHTHLVKGLDYALLQKMKSESVAKASDDPVVKDSERSSQTDDAAEIKFSTILGRNIYNILFSERQNVGEMFYPGRMAFVYDLEQEFRHDYIPVVLNRSKTQRNPFETRTIVPASESIIQKLSHILSYLRGGRASKKTKLVPTPQSVPAKPKDDTNIYDDIGTYDSVESLKRYQQERGVPATVSPYVDLQRKPQKLASKNNSLVDQLISDFNDSNLRKTNKTVPTSNYRLEKKLETLYTKNESYSESLNFPLVETDLKVVIDSDDDDDAMQTFRKRPLVNEWDFNNEEEYQKYLTAKEATATPGGKPNDKKNKKQSANKKKVKLENEWQKINRMISTRKSQASDPFVEKEKKKRLN